MTNEELSLANVGVMIPAARSAFPTKAAEAAAERRG